MQLVSIRIRVCAMWILVVFTETFIFSSINLSASDHTFVWIVCRFWCLGNGWIFGIPLDAPSVWSLVYQPRRWVHFVAHQHVLEPEIDIYTNTQIILELSHMLTRWITQSYSLINCYLQARAGHPLSEQDGSGISPYSLVYTVYDALQSARSDTFATSNLVAY